MLQNTERTWGTVAIALHWLIAIMILGQLLLGTIAAEARISPLKLDLFAWHKSVGVSILVLVVLRIAWRLGNPPPNAPEGIMVWEERVAKAGHRLLYLLMVAVPVTGWWVSDTSRIPFRLFRTFPVPDLMAPDRELSELAADVHGVLAMLLLAVIVVHILAAFRHHFVLRNDTLLRMLPFRQSSRT